MRSGEGEFGFTLLRIVVLATFALSLAGAESLPAKARKDSTPSAASNTRLSLRGPVLREIDDPATGGRWLLLRNAERPAGPGRLIQVTNAAWGSEGRSQGPGGGVPRDRNGRSAKIVIRAGDALTLEQHTPLLDAQFEATALEPAAAGETLKVRLKVSGKVVVVVAKEAGKAELEAARGTLP
jgi:hypothetical protein